MRDATARMQQNGTAVLETDSLVMYEQSIPNHFSGSVLDLADNDLIVHGGSYNTIAQYLTAGYDNNTWLGENTNGVSAACIISSVAAADPTQTEALGYAQIGTDTGDGELNLTTFDGVNVNPGDVVVAFTVYGDANLDGTVDATDLAILNQGNVSGLSGWSNGDFNYDGVVNGNDFSLFDRVYVCAPSNLSVISASSSDVDLAWDEQCSTGLEDTIYESCDDGISFNQIAQVDSLAAGCTNSFDVSGLQSGTIYKFCITAANASSSSTPSGTVSAQTTGIPEAANLEAIAVSPNQVELT